jgi:hypothetical protein
MSLALALSAAVFAGEPPAKSPAPDAVHGGAGGDVPGAATPGVDAPDADFIEFLGSDDVGDAALWAYLKKSAQRNDSPSVPPQQDANQ